MNTARKVIYYLVGVAIGVVLVYFIFGNRDIQCSYFPNDRVLYDLRKKDLHFSQNVEEKYHDTILAEDFLLMGDVDFERSATENTDTCNHYIIVHSTDSAEYEMQVYNCDKTARITRITAQNSNL